MATTEVLDLLLTAHYAGGAAFGSLASDIESLMTATNGLSRLGSAFKVAGDLMVGAGVALAAGLGKAVQVAAQYDQAIQRVVAVTPALQQHANLVAQLNNQIGGTGTQYGISPTSIAQASYFLFSSLGSLGLSGSQFLNTTTPLGNSIINDLGAYVRASGWPGEGGVSITDAAQLLPRIFAAANLPLSQWGGGMGTMTFLENQAHTTQSQLANALNAFLPTMAALNIPFPDAATLMAAVASSGRIGAPAGRELMSALTLMFGGAPQQAEMAKLGLKNDMFFKNNQLLPPEQVMSLLQGAIYSHAQNPADVQSIEHSLFGQVGMRVLGPLLSSGGMDKYFNLVNEQKSLGIYNNPKMAELYMREVADSMMQGPAAQFDRFKAAMEMLAITVGNVVIPPLEKLGNIADNVAMKLIGFMNAHPQLSGALAVGGVPALVGGGFAMKGIGGLLQMAGAFNAGVMGRNAEGALNAAGSLDQWKNLVAGKNQQFETLQAGAVQDLERWQGQTTLSNQRFDALQAGAAQDVERWNNLTSSSNQRFEGILAADAEKKQRLYTQALDGWMAKRSGIEQQAAQKLDQLTKSYETTRAGVPLGKTSGSVLEVDQKFAQDKAAIEQQMRSDLAALKVPKRADFMTPFSGNFPAMPLRPPGQYEGPFPATPLRPSGEFEGAFGAMPLKPEAFKPEATIGEKLLAPFKAITGRGNEIGRGLATAIGHGLTTGFSALQGLDLSRFERSLDLRAVAHNASQGLNSLIDSVDGVAIKFSQSIHPVQLFKDGMSKLPQVQDAVGSGISKLVTGGVDLLKGGFTSLIPTLAGFAGAALPIIGIVLLIAGAITAVVLLFTAFRSQGEQIVSFLGSIFGPVFQAIGGAVQLAIQQIQQAWAAAYPSISSAMDQLVAAFHAAEPVFQAVAIVIGIVVVTVIGVLGNLVGAFISILAPIISVFAGILNIIGGVFNILIGIFTLNGDKIAQGWNQLWTGVQQVVTGILHAILGFIANFIDGVAHFFQDLLKNVPIVGGFANALTGIFDKISGGISNMFGGDTKAKVAGSQQAVFNSLNGQADNEAAIMYQKGKEITQALLDGTYAQNIQENIDAGAAARANAALHGRGGLPHFASGGVMRASGWAMVGEHGPELVRLPGGSRVYNNSETSRIGSMHVDNLHMPGQQSERDPLDHFKFTQYLDAQRQALMARYNPDLDALAYQERIGSQYTA